jgi:hypothetical protein
MAHYSAPPRKAPSRPIRAGRYGLLFLAFIGGSIAVRGIAEHQAESQLRTFVQGNETLILRLRRLPKSRSRDQRIENARRNLKWASAYRQSGIDPDFATALRYEGELDDERLSKSPP